MSQLLYDKQIETNRREKREGKHGPWYNLSRFLLKGKVGQSWCSSYRKENLRVTLDYGRQLYLLYNTYIQHSDKKKVYLFPLIHLMNSYILVPKIMYWQSEVFILVDGERLNKYTRHGNCSELKTHSPSLSLSHTHTHTHTYIYIYKYLCVCVCVCGIFI